MPQLTIGNVPLLFDFYNVAQSALDRFQRLEELTVPPQNTSMSSWMTNPAKKDGRVGLPRITWPAAPPLKINQLYWPCTGATRWAFGVFLVNTEGKEAIEELDCTQPLDLVSTTSTDAPADEIDGEDDTEFTAKVYVLRFHRVVGAADAECDHNDTDVVDPSDLYLCVVVDQRWFWQFRNVDDIKAAVQTDSGNCDISCLTWNDVLDHLFTQLGLAHNFTSSWPESYDYYGPDCNELGNRQWDNAALALDAVAATLGCRVVAGFDGSIEVQRPADAEAMLAENLENMENQLAGFLCEELDTRGVPPNVDVVFPKSKDNHLLCEDERYPLRSTTDDLNCSIPNTVKTFHVTGTTADYSDQCTTDGDPDNLEDLADLTSQIALDWHSWSAMEFDFTFSSPQAWVPNGFDDCAIIKFGWEHDAPPIAHTHVEEDNNDELTAMTTLEPQFGRDHQIRVQSLPWNVGVDSLLLGNDQTMLPDNVLVEICDCWRPDDCCMSEGSSGPASEDPWQMTDASTIRWCSCDYVVDEELTIPVYSALAYPGDDDLRSQLQALFMSQGDSSGNGACSTVGAACCDRMWAHWNCPENRWHVEAKWDDVWRFELDEDLCRFGCAQAHLRLSCCNSDEIIDTEVTFEVCDANGLICENKFYGVSTETSSAGECTINSGCGCVPAGTQGVARFMRDMCRFELQSLELCDEHDNYWVEATECIIPGETGTGDLKRRNSDGDLETVCTGIEVDNSDCLILALPGETFPVEVGNCSDINTSWRPTAQFGITRMARVKKDDNAGLIDCGAAGKAKILQLGESMDTSNPSDCELTETDCEIDICNTSGHPLLCNIDEENITVTLDPSTCQFFVHFDERPKTAKAVLGENLCGTDPPLITDAEFPTTCAWDETIETALNPMSLIGCSGDTVVLNWQYSKEEDECGWYIVNIAEHGSEVLMDIGYDQTCSQEGSGNQITKCAITKTIKAINYHTCDCNQSPATETAITLEARPVVVGVSTGTSSAGDCGATLDMTLTKMNLCVFPSCNDEVEEEVPGWTFHGESVITYLSFDGTCFEATVSTIYAPAVCDTTTMPIICGTECPTDTSSSSGGGGSGSLGTCGDMSVTYAIGNCTTSQYNFTITDSNGNVISSGGCAGAGCCDPQTFPLNTPLVDGETYTITIRYDNGATPPVVVDTETYTFTCTPA